MYRQMIRESSARNDHIGVNPAWVEAWMRLENGTLDALSRPQFDAEVSAAIKCIEAATAGDSESLAKSFGLAS